MWAFVPWRWYHHCVNANTLIEAAILFLGHPYIWTMLLWAHNSSDMHGQDINNHALLTDIVVWNQCSHASIVEFHCMCSPSYASVCICQRHYGCICVSVTQISRRMLELSTAEYSTGTAWPIVLDFWVKALFYSYGVICSSRMLESACSGSPSTFKLRSIQHLQLQLLTAKPHGHKHTVLVNWIYSLATDPPSPINVWVDSEERV